MNVDNGDLHTRIAAGLLGLGVGLGALCFAVGQNYIGVLRVEMMAITYNESRALEGRGLSQIWLELEAVRTLIQEVFVVLTLGIVLAFLAFSFGNGGDMWTFLVVLCGAFYMTTLLITVYLSQGRLLAFGWRLTNYVPVFTVLVLSTILYAKEKRTPKM